MRVRVYRSLPAVDNGGDDEDGHIPEEGEIRSVAVASQPLKKAPEQPLDSLALPVKHMTLERLGSVSESIALLIQALRSQDRGNLPIGTDRCLILAQAGCSVLHLTLV